MIWLPSLQPGLERTVLTGKIEAEAESEGELSSMSLSNAPRAIAVDALPAGKATRARR